MENNFFLNEAPIPPPSSSSPSSSIATWNSLSSSLMDLQPSSFFNPTWQNPTLHHQQFHSASPNHNLPIRELIGKLGNINNETNHNNHSTNPPLMPPLNSTSVAEFSADPGFAERAAKFSCFGSRSFNGRTTTTTATTHTQIQDHRSDAPPLMMTKMMMQNGGGRLHRVSSTPSLKPLQSQSSNTNSPLNSQEEDESTISHQNPNGEISGIMMKPSPPDVNSRKRKPSSSSSSKASKPKDSSTSSLIPPPKGGEANEDSNAKRRKGDEGEGNEEGKQNKSSSNESKPAEPPKDYIHVRARRGQATDSHSLAERVRREKISERMKLLQDLVPGCNKVTGKALMLDEIINYVQSLQRQVEFLSMKLASVNTRLDLSIDNLITKDIFESNNNNNSIGQPGTAIFPSDSSAQPFCGQNPAIHTNANLTHCSVESLDNALFGLQLPPLNAFNELGSQYPMSFCEDDLHTIVQMGFGQTENRKTPTQSPVFNGSNQLSHMKVEL